MKNNTKLKFDTHSLKIAAISLLMIVIIAAIIIVASGRKNDNVDNDISTTSEQNIADIDSETKEDTDEIMTIAFGDIEVEINEDIPTNKYTQEVFSFDETGFITYSGDGASYGIDVSAFQGEIDWTAVSEAGIDFAIIRLGYRGMSEGVLYTDDCFYSNIDGAAAAGIDIGIYFFSQAVTTKEAEEEAKYVLEVLDGRALQYPVIFDWEPGYDEADRTNPLFSSPAVNDFAEAFCSIIKEAGYESGIYYNSYQGYIQYDLSRFSDSFLWLAEYDTRPEFYYAFDMWQYSCEGTVSGIETPVDLNIHFNKR